MENFRQGVLRERINAIKCFGKERSISFEMKMCMGVKSVLLFIRNIRISLRNYQRCRNGETWQKLTNMMRRPAKGTIPFHFLLILLHSQSIPSLLQPNPSKIWSLYLYCIITRLVPVPNISFSVHTILHHVLCILLTAIFPRQVQWSIARAHPLSRYAHVKVIELAVPQEILLLFLY